MSKEVQELRGLILKQAEQIGELTSSMSELKAQRVQSVAGYNVEVTGTDNTNAIKFVKSIYNRKKYNKGGKIKSITIDNIETTKGGFPKITITKTLEDGTTKTHPVMDWSKLSFGK